MKHTSTMNAGHTLCSSSDFWDCHSYNQNLSVGVYPQTSGFTINGWGPTGSQCGGSSVTFGLGPYSVSAPAQSSTGYNTQYLSNTQLYWNMMSASAGICSQYAAMADSVTFQSEAEMTNQDQYSLTDPLTYKFDMTQTYQSDLGPYTYQHSFPTALSASCAAWPCRRR